MPYAYTDILLQQLKNIVPSHVMADQNVILSEEARHKRVYIPLFHSYKFQNRKNKSRVTESKAMDAEGRDWGRRILLTARGTKNFRVDKCLCLS